MAKTQKAKAANVGRRKRATNKTEPRIANVLRVFRGIGYVMSESANGRWTVTQPGPVALTFASRLYAERYVAQRGLR